MKQAITLTCAILVLALLLAGCGKTVTENSEPESTTEISNIEISAEAETSSAFTKKYMSYTSFKHIISEYKKYVEEVSKDTEFDHEKANVFLEPIGKSGEVLWGGVYQLIPYDFSSEDRKNLIMDMP